MRGQIFIEVLPGLHEETAEKVGENFPCVAFTLRFKLRVTFVTTTALFVFCWAFEDHYESTLRHSPWETGRELRKYVQIHRLGEGYDMIYMI